MAIEDMVKRHSEFDDTKDFIPTPAWATRVLYELVAPRLKARAKRLMVLDPAMGGGHMLKVFQEYDHPQVQGSDLYEHPRVEGLDRNCLIWSEDFVEDPPFHPADVIVSNPPYKHLNAFILRALDQARFGVGMLVRVQAMESEGRYLSIFRDRPPTQVAFFSNRIPFKTGRVMKKAPKMYFHVWLWWEKDYMGKLVEPKPPMWIPFDAQQQYERDEDYA